MEEKIEQFLKSVYLDLDHLSISIFDKPSEKSYFIREYLQSIPNHSIKTPFFTSEVIDKYRDKIIASEVFFFEQNPSGEFGTIVQLKEDVHALLCHKVDTKGEFPFLINAVVYSEDLLRDARQFVKENEEFAVDSFSRNNQKVGLDFG